jgi:hypothetical protein
MIDQVLLLSNEYLWNQLDHMKKSFKNDSIEDIKWYVRHNDSWRRINNDLTMINHALEKCKWESWCWCTGYDGEEKVDI